MTAQTAESCRNCGAPLGGPYCHQCGERRVHPEELTVRHFVHDTVHEFTHLDAKIFRTLWLLIRRPGLLTAEYWAGRRKPYIRPLRLYLVIAALHLLVVSATLYRLEMFRAQDRGTLQRYVTRQAARFHLTPVQVEEHLNRKIAKVYSGAQYLSVLGFACAPLLLYRRRRPYYVEHLVFSLHVYSFYFVVTAMVGPFVTPQAWQRSPMMLISLVYLLFALRRLHRESWAVTAWKALVLRLALFGAEFVVLAISLTSALFLFALLGP